MILQVDEEIHELIIQCLLECGFVDEIDDITVYQECYEKIEDDEEKINVEPKTSKKKKNKKLYVD
tara:strand:+ start:1458 stop:1652 length:195 start_codon:yes stop_codon:yes gene_type:complete